MGRPVNKRYFGALADGTNITINCKVGGNAASDQGMIINQRSVNKFRVDDSKLGSGNEGVCTLVNKAVSALLDNEMSIDAVIAGGTTSGGIRIKKLYNRTCRDFNNNRYTWAVQNDSTVSLFVLTPI